MPIERGYAKVVLHDHDLHFQGHKFESLISFETVADSAKRHDMTLLDFDICHRTIPLRKLYSMTLT